MSPRSQLRAVDIVEIPEGKTTEEDAQAVRNHGPHRSQRCQIPLILLLLRLLLPWSYHALRLPISVTIRMSVGWYLHSLVSILRSDVGLHDVHCSYENECREDRVGVLMECRILQVVIVQRDECGERKQEEREACLRLGRLVEAECRKEHEAGRVDHGQFVDQLHGIYSRSV